MDLWELEVPPANFSARRGLCADRDSGDRQRKGTASSRLPYSAAVDGLLPKAFARLPKWDTPYISTLALATVSTFLLVIYQLGDPMRVAYVELVSLMVITSFVPYIYIFASEWKAGKRLSACSGMIVTMLALVLLGGTADRN